MANRNFDIVQALGKEIKIISGNFQPNGSSDIDATTVKGLGFSVSRTGQGVYKVELEDYYVALQSAHVSLQLATADDKFLQIGDVGINTTEKFVEIKVWDISDAALADIAANAGNIVHFTLVLRNSTVGK